MKYIRTKDKKGKQYIVSDKDYIFQIRDNKVIFARGYEEELLGQADTIEELCDEFVLAYDEDNYPTLLEEFDLGKKTFLRKNEYEFSHKLPNEPIIYGAIWTKWGLKYVAKMNEKGELELI